MSDYKPEKGDRVHARRYEQPTLRRSDPDRRFLGEWTGTANAHNGMLTDDGPARSTYLSFEDQFLGGRPELGTSRWAVTEVERAPEPRKRSGRTR